MSKVRTVGDYFKLQGGYAYKSRDFTTEGVPVVKIGNVTGGVVDLSSTQFIPEEIADKTTDFLSDEGDVLIAMTGANVGKVARVQPGDKQFAINQRVGRFLPKINENLSKDFLYYLVSFKESYLFFKNAAYGSAQPNISGKLIESLSMPTITVELANKIGSILKTLDDKIALNRKLNETLEGIARALFQSWFVDFDPVKAKLAAMQHGRDPEKACMAALSGKLRIPPGKPKPDTLDDQLPIAEELDAAIATLNTLSEAQHNKLAQTAAHFPTTFQESELGLVPEGWTITNIESVIQLAYGKALKKTERQNGDVPVYGSGGVNGYHNKHLIEGPGIIIGRKGTVGSIYWEQKNFFPIDTVFYVKPKEGIPLIWTLYLLETLGLKEMNTDAAVPGLNRNNVYRIELPDFPFRLIQLFASETSAIRKEIDADENQSRTLAELRDTLLPKLLSGELQVEPN